MRVIKKGAADQSVVIRIVDSTDGTPETAVEHNSSGIDLWYRREGAAKVSITEAALTALTDAHSDGGIEHIGDGYYRLDLPDAAFASGASGVMIGGTVTGMVVIGCYVHLVDYDPQDTVRLGLTALPNAAADAAGGLPISDAGGLDLDTRLGYLTGAAALETTAQAILADTGTDIPATLSTIAGYIDTEITSILTHLTDIKGAGWTTTDTLEAIRDRGDAAWVTATGFSTLDAAGVRTAVGLASANLDTQLGAIVADTGELQTDWADGGRLDLLIDAIKAKSDNLPASPAAVSDVPTVLQIWTTALAEAYRASGETGSGAQMLYEILQNLTEFAISGTTKTVKKLDGSTTAKTYTLDDASAPTSITETT